MCTNVAEVFKLRGFVPSYLQRRIKRIQTSGNWEWWNTIVENRYLFQSKEKNALPLVKPTMAGNILIIFAALLTGMVISLTCFLMEAWRKLLKSLRKLILIVFMMTEFIGEVDKVIDARLDDNDCNLKISVVVHKPLENDRVR